MIAQSCDLRLSSFMLLDVGLVRLVQTGLHLARRDCLLRIMAESNESGEASLSNVIPAQEAEALTAPKKPCSVVGGTNEDIFSSSGTSLLQMLAQFTLVELEQLLHFGWPGSTLDPLNPSLLRCPRRSTWCPRRSIRSHASICGHSRVFTWRKIVDHFLG